MLKDKIEKKQLKKRQKKYLESICQARNPDNETSINFIESIQKKNMKCNFK